MITLRRSAMESLLASLVVMITGCSAHPPAPLSEQFDSPAQHARKHMPAEPLSDADQPGALHESVTDSTPAHIAPSPSKASIDVSPEPVSPTVQQNVTMPGTRTEQALPEAQFPAATARSASTQSTSGPAIGISSGQYYTLGGVVAEVNNTPIYANKVLKLVEPILAARAKDLGREQFRITAQREITSQIHELIARQLEYAAAERNLDSKDKEIADLMTAQWRNQQITEAGGSIELARARATARGEDFDDLVQEQYRTNMARRFYQKKVIPRIQLSAQEMRQYYDSHRSTEFTQKGTARFRLIKIDIRKSGGREPAQDRIDGLRARVVKAGEPFEVVAHEVNDDPHLLRTGGDLGAAIQQGAFFSDKIEQTVWRTPVGKVTPVIDTGDALYIAEVEAKTPEKVEPFENEQVQSRIEATLESEQFRAMRLQVQEKLLKEAIVRSTPQMQEIAVEMAIENYPKWARG